MTETAEKRAKPTHSPGPYRAAEWSHRLNGCEICDCTGLAIGIAYYLGGTEQGRINAHFLTAPDTAAERDQLLAALTPSAETKAAYMGEFSHRAEQIDEDGNAQSVTYFVPWTTIKEIMAAILTHAVLKAHGPATEAPHKCARCGEPNPEHLDRDGCRDPDCPEQEPHHE